MSYNQAWGPKTGDDNIGPGEHKDNTIGSPDERCGEN